MDLLFIEDVIVGGIGSGIAMLIGIVITAFFVPNMLRKGTVDMLLVKPISRVTLLLYKYVGGLTFIFLNTVVAVGGVWLALGLRSGVWATGFLVMILVITFFFAILYSVSTLFGVLTRSPIVAILLTLRRLVGVVRRRALGYQIGSSDAQQATERVRARHAASREKARTADLPNRAAAARAETIAAADAAATLLPGLVRPRSCTLTSTTCCAQ